ncbi:3-isopropylmalate dehydratase small subunit [Pyrobaculum aerophilum]|uniref:3-isopropylmalate dehydratase small subunit n=2 Tax=Pyrobaculum aerophilum TaxID=13773 RepID=LEUD_PYRAE|nr:MULTISPECIES: 3-isopropylmalate dehydratase small subunit [Pyrobaculum]Q8ZW36.1 RecName: Full=3-isopropylmalate dehydratase small subunit; AltName: Full=Alpha-IPM isomerase; Short=IPMI; AltName: Full=Isopropylmalate isomerase [Pyrobaculum aerophilum str. IM2]AAL63866.1 3-isopropylmalate dehydratase small subunit (leuD) [Pyrobaculum aerophilum str. IM2]MCX8136932.1 3-isopropylmalate dehydratase small subunit [Pyrobaculum aerophilum]RFA92380.1 3-isopropylmalate dehydratase [Pyrobaculum aerophi
MKIRGRALVYGDKIDTDVIIPAKYLVYTDPALLGQHAMEPLDPEFPKKAKGAVLVAGRAFGMGSSREQAALALKGAGVLAVVAESFARIFFRNAINVGLPVLQAPGIREKVKDGDEVELDVEGGIVRNITTGEVIVGKPLRGLPLEILKAGGLLNYLKNSR